MDSNTNTMTMVISKMPRKSFATVLFAFSCVLLLATLIGVLGPHMWEYHTVSSAGCPTGRSDFDHFCGGVYMAAGETWNGTIMGLTKLNDQMRLICTVAHRGWSDRGDEKKVSVAVSIAGRSGSHKDWEPTLKNEEHKRSLICPEGERVCQNMTLIHLPFVEYPDYQINVTFQNMRNATFMGDVLFTYEYVNHSFTLFEIWFRFVFLTLSFTVLILFCYALRNYQWREYTLEQKWTTILLLGVMAYNNPMYPLAILLDGWMPAFIDQLLLVTFLSLLLLFWSILFHGISKESRPFVKFYLPKIVFVALFWIFGLFCFTWVELHQLDNPEISEIEEFKGYRLASGLLTAWVVVYFIMLLVVFARAVTNDTTAVRMKFFSYFTLVVIVLTTIGLLYRSIGPESNTAAEFLSFIALFNLYVYSLAVLYLPFYASSVAGGMTRLREEHELQNRGEFVIEDYDDQPGRGDDITEVDIEAQRSRKVVRGSGQTKHYLQQTDEQKRQPYVANVNGHTPDRTNILPAKQTDNHVRLEEDDDYGDDDEYDDDEYTDEEYTDDDEEEE